MIEDVKLSIVMITYGHEKYISHAINSILTQKTNFNIEFIIANDSSPDQSDDIIKSLTSNVPDNFTIKYTRHEKNVGMIPNFIWALKQAKGEYVAICEGDDYWIDDNKLQKQVDFLENNKDYVISHHRVKYLINDEETLLPHHKDKNSEKTNTLESLSHTNFINTLSVVYRNENIDLPDWFKYLTVGDYPLWLTLAKNGKIHYNPDIMGVYRYGTGFHSSLNFVKSNSQVNFSINLLVKNAKFSTHINDNLNNQIAQNTDTIIKRQIFNYYTSDIKKLKKIIPFKFLIKILIKYLTKR